MHNWFELLITIVACVNFLFLIAMVFLEQRKPQYIIAWLTVMTFLPVIGFGLYVIFGSGLSVRTRRMIKKKSISERDIIRNIKGIQTLEEAKLDGILKDDKELMTLCYFYGSYPLPGNDIKIFNSGIEKINALKNDLKNAKKSINMEYYIFADDVVGKEVMDILCQKAREGVEVKLIYDSVGSRKAPRRFFRRLEKAGGEIGEFFPPFMHIRLLNLKLNYRNHRKIVVIDGKIGYTGGINIRDDHMGKDKKLKPWRDTHIKIEGSGVYALQNIFLDDWRYCKNDNTPPQLYLANGYFPSPELNGNATIQVMTSGPDSQVQRIKETFVQMIINAGASSIEHSTFLDKEIDEQLIEKGIYVVPTFLPYMNYALYGEENNQLMDTVLAARAIVSEKKTRFREAYEMGVKIAFGRDSGGFLMDQGKFVEEMLFMEDAGMSRADIINSATRNAADLLGISDITGTIEDGKDADLVILRSNPLDDLKAFEESLDGVYARGVFVEREEDS